MESEGTSWYNGLEVSLTKRLAHALQFLASYTFSKTPDTDGADINPTSAANALTLGNQNSPQQRWGRAGFDLTHRFVFSATWSLPRPISRTRTGGSGWLGRRCGGYDSIWQCPHHLRHKCQQRVWDQRGPGAAERNLLEKPTGQRRVGGVEIGRLFQCRLLRVHQLLAPMASERRLATVGPEL
jgi:hypothetical protein